jgi:hypothetical protein
MDDEGCEYGAQGLGLLGDIEKTNAKYQYVTDDTLRGFNEREARSVRFFDGTTLCDTDGNVIAMPTDKRSYARLSSIYARAKAFEILAGEMDMIPVFLTLTLPGEYHATPSKERETEWAGYSTKEGHKELCKRWRGLGRELSRLGLTPPLSIRVTEPHKSGCEHWHVLVYLPAGSSLEEFKELSAKHFDRDGGSERKHCKVAGEYHSAALKIVVIDKAVGGATSTSYVMGYVFKNLETSDTNAQKACAWRSANNIRAVQFAGKLGQGTATLWNEFRRLRLGTDRAPRGVTPTAAELFLLAQGAPYGQQAEELASVRFAKFVMQTARLKNDGRLELARTKRASGTTKITGLIVDGEYVNTRPRTWFQMPRACMMTLEEARELQIAWSQRRPRNGAESLDMPHPLDCLRHVSEASENGDAAVSYSYPRNTGPDSPKPEKYEFDIQKLLSPAKRSLNQPTSPPP